MNRQPNRRRAIVIARTAQVQVANARIAAAALALLVLVLLIGLPPGAG